MNKLFKHLKLVHNHRKRVFELCVKAGIPFQGLVHDLSKYSLSELKESVKYYDGTMSPLAVCKKENGYSFAWMHHKGRNKHHLEYYVDVDARDKAPIIPYKYVVEMICDTLSAGRTYMGYDWSPKKQLEFFYMRKDLDYINPKIFKMIERVYLDIDKYGIDKVIKKENLTKLYNEIVLSDYPYTVYLAGTCGNSKWRDKFVTLIDEDVRWFSPVKESWSHEVESENAKIKRDCKYILYVVTSETNGMLSIANMIDAVNKNPSRTLVCFLRDGFNDSQKISIEEIEMLVERNRGTYFDSLESVAEFINNNKNKEAKNENK